MSAVPRAAVPGRQRRSLGRAALIAVCGLIFLFLIAPTLVVIPMSFNSSTYLIFPPPGFSLQWYQNYFGVNPSYTGMGNWLAPTIRSAWIALVVAILSSLLGVPAALGLVRGRFPARGIINALNLSPLIVPEIIIAIAVYFVLAPIHLVGNPVGLILAQTALGVPFVVINVSASLYGVDERLERAAQVLGASPLRAFWSITLPLIRPGILAGALFAFITSWDDLLVPIFMSGTGAVTLPLRIWQGLREQIDPTVSAVATLLVASSAVLLISAEMLRRRQERLRTRPIEAPTVVTTTTGTSSVAAK